MNLRRVRCGRQNDPEHRSFRRPLTHADSPAVDLDRPLRNRKAQACAALIAGTGFVDPKEPIEDTVAMLGRNPWALVRNLEHRSVWGFLYADVNRRLPRAVFDRIIDDVRDRLPHNQTIAGHNDSFLDRQDESLTSLLREKAQR